MSAPRHVEWRPLAEERHELGEGARAVPAEGEGADGAVEFVAVDLLAGRLLRPGGGELLRIDDPLGAVAPLAGGGWIAAAGTGIALIGVGGDVRWLAQPEADATTPMRMNDGVADPSGRFWAGSMAYDGTPGAGSLYRVDLDGSVHRVVAGLTVPNGPAFDATGAVMYLADSARGVIDRCEIDVESGAVVARERFAEIGDASPDGMTVDAEGCLWSALWGGSRLHRYGPDGALIDVVAVPAAQPTSIAISPVAPFEALVTTAAHGIKTPEREDGRLLSGELGVAGVAAAVCRVAG